MEYLRSYRVSVEGDLRHAHMDAGAAAGPVDHSGERPSLTLYMTKCLVTVSTVALGDSSWLVRPVSARGRYGRNLRSFKSFPGNLNLVDGRLRSTDSLVHPCTR